MFLKLENPPIDGTSMTPRHEREIEVLSWSHGFSQQTSPTRPGSEEQAAHSPFNFSKYLDVATSALLKLCWTGKQIGKATVTCLRPDTPSGSPPVEYLTIIMEHVVITNYSVSGGPGDVPVENLSLEYGIVTYRYAPQAAGSGSETSAKHNRKTGVIE